MKYRESLLTVAVSCAIGSSVAILMKHRGFFEWSGLFYSLSAYFFNLMRDRK